MLILQYYKCQFKDQSEKGELMHPDVCNPACLVIQKNHTATFRLFCFPYAGGGASAFRQWSTHLPDWVEVCAVQPPGRENRITEKPVSNVHELVKLLLPSMSPWFHKPFAFFGHSTGALVAFELARKLHKKNLPLPVHLFVSAARAPHIPEPSPLHHLPKDEFIQELRRFSGTPDAILQNQELMEIFIPILKADLAIEETYTLIDETPFEIPISAFYGSRDKEAPESVMLPWQQYTTSFFEICRIEGDHFFIKNAKNTFLSSLTHILEPPH